MSLPQANDFFAFLNKSAEELASSERETILDNFKDGSGIRQSFSHTDGLEDGMFQNLLEELLRSVKNCLTRPTLRHLTAFTKRPRETQSFPEVVITLLEREATAIRRKWEGMLGVPNSPDRPFEIKAQLLMTIAKESAAVFNEEEDTMLLEEIVTSGGVKVGVCSRIELSGLWPLTKASKINSYHSVELALPVESWRNYKSAEINSKEVYDHLLAEVELGFMRLFDADKDVCHALTKLALIPKSGDNGFRIIDDYLRSGVNSAIVENNNELETVCLPSIKEIAFLINESAVVNKEILFLELDIKSAFRHVPLSREDASFCVVECENQKFIHNRLPFGLMTSPVIWSRVAGVVLRLMKRVFYCVDLSSRRVLNRPRRFEDFLNPLALYVDDLGSPVSKRDFGVSLIIILLLWRIFNFEIAWKKLKCGVMGRMLGFNIDVGRKLISLPDEKLEETLFMLDQILGMKEVESPSVCLKFLQSLLGRLARAATILANIKPFLSVAYATCAHGETQKYQKVSVGKKLLIQFQHVRLVLEQHRTKAVNMADIVGVCSWQQKYWCLICTDASISGFGFVGMSNQGKWYGYGTWSDYLAQEFKCSDICFLELLTVLIALMSSTRSNDQDTLVFSDNTSTVISINKRYSGTPRMMKLLNRGVSLGLSLQNIKATHLRGDQNWLPDKLSRGEIPVSLEGVADPVDRQKIASAMLMLDPCSNLL
jgi:hypothetical protein